MLKKYENKVTMVFAVDAFNKSTYVNYTRDDTLGHFLVNGKEMGKQIFTEMNLKGEDLQEFMHTLPVDTHFSHIPDKNGIYQANIQYYIDPKSVFGVILNDYKNTLTKNEREKAHLEEVAVNFREKYFKLEEERREDRDRDNKAYKSLELEKKSLSFNYEGLKNTRKNDAERFDEVLAKQSKKSRMLHVRYATIIGLILLSNIYTFMSI